LKPSTRATFESILSKHVPPAGDRLHCRTWHTRTSPSAYPASSNPLSPSTLRHVHRVFSLLLDLAVRSSRIHRNPAPGARLPRVQIAEKRFLSQQEVNALAQAAGDYRVAVLLLSYCGLRWGELAALKLSRVDLLRHRLSVAEAVSEVHGKLIWGTPKSHQARSVPIPGFLVDDLTVAMAGKAPDALIVVSTRRAVLPNLNFRRDVFDPAATAVGLDGLTPHELRHPSASLAVSAGANVKAVQRMLGHASAAMTLDVYSGLFDDNLDGVAEQLDASVRVYSNVYRHASPAADSRKRRSLTCAFCGAAYRNRTDDLFTRREVHTRKGPHWSASAASTKATQVSQHDQIDVMYAQDTPTPTQVRLRRHREHMRIAVAHDVDGAVALVGGCLTVRIVRGDR
jgi:integrase